MQIRVRELSEYKSKYNSEREKELTNMIEKIKREHVGTLKEATIMRKDYDRCKVTKDVYKDIFLAARVNK